MSLHSILDVASDRLDDYADDVVGDVLGEVEENQDDSVTPIRKPGFFNLGKTTEKLMDEIYPEPEQDS